MTAPHPVVRAPATRYRHEAIVHRGPQEYVDQLVPFLREGVAAGEPTLVVVPPAKIELLSRELGPQAGSVRFVDMHEAGRNPARLIPLWRKFVEDSGGRPVRGVGEPVWAGRRPEELAEALLHEALIDIAFADGPALRLWCPYDAAVLAASVVDAGCAGHNPPGRPPSGRAAAEFARPLAPAADAAEAVVFTELHSVRRLRALVTDRAGQAGIDQERTADLVLAAHEVAVNSLRHGGERGTLRIWSSDTALVVEVSDAGHIVEPLVGRVRPLPAQRSGRGVWLANQLCDLVQIRSSPAGTAVRLHMYLR